MTIEAFNAADYCPACGQDYATTFEADHCPCPENAAQRAIWRRQALQDAKDATPHQDLVGMNWRNITI